MKNKNHRASSWGRWLQIWALGCLPTGERLAAEELPLLTTVGQVRRLTLDEAGRGYPVRLRVTVTFARYGGGFIQDDTGGIYVNRRRSRTAWQAGQRLDWDGVTVAEDFTAGLEERSVHAIGKGPLPAPRRVTLDELASARAHCEWVEVSGVVRSATMSGRGGPAHLQLAAGASQLRADVFGVTEDQAGTWVDARVRVRGVAGSFFNPQRQFAAPLLLVSGATQVVVETPAPADPFGLPARPVHHLMQLIPYGASDHRVKVAGVVTFHQPGEFLFLQSGNQGVLARSSLALPLQAGDQVEAAGFATAGGYTPRLEDAVYRRTNSGDPPAPVRVAAEQLLSGQYDSVLVSLEARLLETIRGRNEDTLVLQAGNLVFNAGLLRGPPPARLRPGSRLRLSGICEIQELNNRVSLLQPESFRLRLRSPEDITILQAASWWTTGRLLQALGLLAVTVVAVLLWVWTLHRRVREQSAVIHRQARREAALEERARLAREVHDTLAQGFSGLGFQLQAIADDLEPAASRLRERLTVAARMVRHNQEEVRRYLVNLRVAALEKGSLADALPEAARQLAAGTGMQLDCAVRGPACRLPDTAEDNLLRIAQEAVTNACRHAKPRRVTLELIYGEAAVQLRVADDGCGFDPLTMRSPTEGHFGCQGMRERAEQIGARFTLQSQPGRGTQIMVDLPLRGLQTEPMPARPESRAPAQSHPLS